MQPDLQPGQWEDSVTFRNRQNISETLNPDINENAQYTPEDRSPVHRERPPPPKTPRQQQQHRPAAARKPRHKRSVKDRTSGRKDSSVHKKERSDEALVVLNRLQGPSWLLEPDGEELNSLLPSPFPNDLVKRHMHNRQSSPKITHSSCRATELITLRSPRRAGQAGLQGRPKRQLWQNVRQ
jgi:hypothetical protein